MNLVQAFKMAFKSIAMKKTRSFLTMLGIIIGVASVVIMVSVVSGQNKKQMEWMEAMGNNIVDVYAWSGTGQDMDAIINEYVAALDKKLVVGISPVINLWSEMIVRYGGKAYSTQNWDNWQDRIQIVLGNESYGLCNDYELAEGRELSFLDIEKENSVCVLGGGLKEKLFDYTSPVGETITINGLPYLVVGWYQAKNIEDDYSGMDNVLLLPYTVNRTLNRNQTISDWRIKCTSSSATSEVTARVQSFLDGMFPKDEDGNQWDGYGYANTNNDWQQSAQESARMQTLVMGGIAAISLLVGGIGIMNIMLVTVTERTREIGIRKAIGAERRSIIIQFLIEAAMICGIGGLFGIAAGYIITMVLTKAQFGLVIMPSGGITVAAFGISVALGIIFGLWPAIKASRLQPVEALRAD